MTIAVDFILVMIIMNKIVWVLDSSIDEDYDESTSIMRKYRYDFFLKRWIELIVINILDYDIASMTFSRYKSQKSPGFEVIESQVKPDYIRVRTSKDRWLYISLLGDEFKLLPSPKVICIACDKRYTYNYFKEYQPFSVLMSDISNENLKLMGWDEVVIKPRVWFWWEWVTKVTKNELIKQKWLFDTENYIVQELCDFTQWYNESVTWLHDLRLVFIWWEFSYWSIRRTEIESEFRVNVSQGWIGTYIDYDEIPTLVAENSIELLNQLWWKKTWCISLDWWYDSNKNSRKLIEMNYSPGFVNEDLLPGKVEFLDKAYKSYSDYFNSNI